MIPTFPEVSRALVKFSQTEIQVEDVFYFKQDDTIGSTTNSPEMVQMVNSEITTY